MKTRSFLSLFGLIFLILGILCTSCAPRITKPSTPPTSNAEKIKAEFENLIQEALKLYHQGKLAEAAQKFETTANKVSKDPPTPLLASLYTVLAFLQEKAGDPDKATLTYSVVRNLLQKLKSIPTESDTLALLTRFAYQLKGQDRIQFWEKLRPITTDLYGKAGERGVIWQIGEVYLSMNNYQKAYECGTEALRLAKDFGNPNLEVPASIVISRSLIGLGRIQEAEVLLQEVLQRTREDPISKIGVLSNLGLINAMLGRENETIKYFQDAIALARSIGATEIEAGIEFALGTSYSNFKKPQEALKRLMTALSIFEKLNDKVGIANAEGVIAEVYFQNSSFEEAKQHALRAVELYRQLGRRIEEAKIWRLAGQSWGALNKIDDALKALEKAALIQVEEKDRDGVLGTLWAAVSLSKSAGRIEVAKQVLLMGLNTHASVFGGDVKGERMIRWELAIVCKELGHFSEALDHFDIVFSIYEKLGDRRGKILTLIAMAEIYANLNDYKNRIDLLSFAETLGAEIDDPFIKLMILTHTAGGFADAGDKVEALQRHLEALKILRLVSKQTESEQSIQVGNFYRNISEYAKALQYFWEALRIAKEIGDQIKIARSINFIAGCYLSMNKYDDAIRSAREAIEIIKATQSTMFPMFQSQDLIAEEWHALGVIGSALEAQENYKDALRINQDRLKVAEKLGESIFIKDTYCDIGHNYYEMGKDTEAIENFKGAIQKIELLRTVVVHEELKMGFLSKHLSPYDGIVHASFELHRQSDYKKNEFAEEALVFAEKSKARTWAEQLSRSRVGLIQESVPLEVRNEEKDLLNKLRSADQEYRNALTHLGMSAEEIKQKEKTLISANDKWRSFQEKVRRQYPRYALLQYYVDMPTHFSQLTIKAGETLVLYKVTPDWVYVWVVRRIGGQNKIVRFTRLPSKTFEIEKIVEKLLLPLGRGKYKEFDIKLSNELFNRILKPALDGVEITKRLIIIPDGLLNIIPFEILATGTGCDGGIENRCFLGNQYNIT